VFADTAFNCIFVLSKNDIKILGYEYKDNTKTIQKLRNGESHKILYYTSCFVQFQLNKFLLEGALH